MASSPADSHCPHIGQRLEGGQNVSREFGGGGGNVLQSVLSKTTFGGLRNWGWSGRCLFPFKGDDRESPKRGGKRIVGGGGSKSAFGGGGGGGGFTVCFPAPEFSTPLGRSLIIQGQQRNL